MCLLHSWLWRACNNTHVGKEERNNHTDYLNNLDGNADKDRRD